MLKLTHLTKTYKEKRIFQNARFEAELGEIVLLMGKSGIGKSTLLDIIAGIKQYDSGEYYYQETQLFPENDEQMSRFRNQMIGYILQDFALIDDYTVMENIMLPSLYNSQIKKSTAEKRARELANRFDLSDVLAEKVRKISGGQKQRAAIIRSLILDPPIILADEPTTNLDSENFELVMRLFNQLKQEGKVLIIATHDERILSIADKAYHVVNYKIIV
ncbi:ABC transporter ATP-binding protein [Vagococcus acidifermentans]|uniref:ABC transporter ATP-binding protein n=1 Tax=Vagococcus acidifermentans TaxID=564710 RepID=A0A430AZL0_9ENTE|nr:ABC transporter ATP-binding protein [Vagococcus acidifermentans]RSU13456.1 ABC transporter ATP-binding protein [Vagococcus acidifermentans]